MNTVNVRRASATKTWSTEYARSLSHTALGHQNSSDWLLADINFDFNSLQFRGWIKFHFRKKQTAHHVRTLQWRLFSCKLAAMFNFSLFSVATIWSLANKSKCDLSADFYLSAVFVQITSFVRIQYRFKGQLCNINILTMHGLPQSLKWLLYSLRI